MDLLMDCSPPWIAVRLLLTFAVGFLIGFVEHVWLISHRRRVHWWLIMTVLHRQRALRRQLYQERRQHGLQILEATDALNECASDLRRLRANQTGGWQ